jgi:hypothetical protein
MLIHKKVESYHLTLIVEQKLCLPVIKLESNNYICQFFINIMVNMFQGGAPWWSQFQF